MIMDHYITTSLLHYLHALGIMEGEVGHLPCHGSGADWSAARCRFYQPGTIALRCPGEPPKWMRLGDWEAGRTASQPRDGLFSVLSFVIKNDL